MSYDRDAGLAQLFSRWAGETPDAPAVIDGGRRLSYRKLDQRANALAHELSRRGVEPGHTVGVLGNRGVEAIVAILGVVKTGAAYVPLDTGHPAGRLTAMAEDAGARVVISLSDNEIPGLDERTAAAYLHAGSGEALAYVMFTSGTTGRPKAVGVRQRGVARLVTGTDYITIGPGDRMLHVGSLSFDASTFEIWGALLNGGCLVVADTPVLLSPPDLRRLLVEQDVTTALITTSVFHQLADRQPDMFRSLRDLVVGGEALSVTTARRVLAAGPPRRLINAYGPTENATITTTYLVNDLPPDAMAVPIGTPIAHTTCHILRADGTPAAPGERGELCTGGDGVAVGYLNDPSATEDRFVPDPFDDDPAARMYRTGDVASKRQDGVIEYHGRQDDQVKIQGYRIEPGEVEHALRVRNAIVDAVVVRHESRLVAYVVTTDGSSIGLREHLQELLPPYLVPAVFVVLPRLPLTPHGKVDRAALPPPEVEDTTETVEQQVGRIWSEVLGARGVERTVEPDDTLFDIGGTSFDVPLVHQRVAARFDTEALTPIDLFTYPTLRGYATHVASLLAT